MSAAASLEPRLGAPTGSRRLLALLDPQAPTSLAEHRQHYPVPDVSRRPRRDLIATVQRAGLRGRGGAGFPTGTKLAAVADRRGRPVVVVNGTEGEPTSHKDATLLRYQPHLVLDGAAWAAAAVGAAQILICVDRTRARTHEAVNAAIAEREWGEDGVPMTLMGTPPRYVAGEETALVHWLNGGDARPTITPPRPFERGVDRQPTLIDNVETLAHLGMIIRYGADWFRSMGTEKEPGTALISLTGAVDRPAVYEVGMATPLAQVLGWAGTPPDISAVLIGGYFGTWLAPDVAGRIRLCDDDLRARGGGLGCGAVVALPARSCGVAESAGVLSWMAAETAGQCGPCVNGLAAIADCLTGLTRGEGGPHAIARLERWAEMVDGRGGCRFPDGAIRFLRSTLQVHGNDLRRHAAGRPCADAGRERHLPTPMTMDVWR